MEDEVGGSCKNEICIYKFLLESLKERDHSQIPAVDWGYY
jgi:hypothetical protein